MSTRKAGQALPKSYEKSALVGVYVQPAASRNRLGEKTPRGWKLSVTAPPVEGRANRACIQVLAKLLGVPRSSLRIVQGKTSRQKVIAIDGLALEQIEKRLAAAGDPA